jgi:hypothetical protein
VGVVANGSRASVTPSHGVGGHGRELARGWQPGTCMVVIWHVQHREL